jgi:hypothetical protein
MATIIRQGERSVSRGQLLKSGTLYLRAAPTRFKDAENFGAL